MIRVGSPDRERRNRLAILGIVCLCAVTLSACGRGIETSNGHSRISKPPNQAAYRYLTRSTVVPANGPSWLLPAGFSTLQSLTGDPNGTGAWFWDSTSNEDVIFNSSAGNISEWPVLSGSNFQQSEQAGGLAVDPQGNVWLAINLTLIELDPATGATETWTIPTPSANLAAASFEPSGAAEIAVTGLAASPLGTIAILTSISSTVEVFDPRSSEFDSISMPTDDDLPTAAAFSGDGTLCIGFSAVEEGTGGTASNLMILSPNGQAATYSLLTPGSAWDIAPLGSSSFVVGDESPELATTSGTITSINSPSALVGSGQPMTPLVVAGGDVLVGHAQGGLVAFPDDASSVAQATEESTFIPSAQVCGPSGDAPGPGTSTEGTVCGAPGYFDVVADGDGDLWTVGSGGVSEVPPQTVSAAITRATNRA